MVAGRLELTIGEESLRFEPSHLTCNSCGDTRGFDHAVELTRESPDELAVDVTFLCEICGATQKTTTGTATLPEPAPEEPDDDAAELLDWIESYADREGRHPSKSKCVQSAPFDVMEAQSLLEELEADGRVELVEQLRATTRITVVQPR